MRDEIMKKSNSFKHLGAVDGKHQWSDLKESFHE